MSPSLSRALSSCSRKKNQSRRASPNSLITSKCTMRQGVLAQMPWPAYSSSVCAQPGEITLGILQVKRGRILTKSSLYCEDQVKIENYTPRTRTQSAQTGRRFRQRTFVLGELCRRILTESVKATEFYYQRLKEA
jgi:hypothetical protein